MNKIKIAVINRSKILCEEIQLDINARSEFEFVGSANDGIEGLNLIFKEKPDAIISGMIMNEIDGIGMLEKIKSYGGEYKPFVYILSALNVEEIIVAAMNNGAAGYLVKPFETSVILDRIMEDIKNKEVLMANQLLYPCISEVDDVEVDVTNQMKDLGLSSNTKGYIYIKEALIMSINDPKRLSKVTKDLYPEIANRFDTTASRVERAIRHAVQVSWERSEAKEIEKIFGSANNYKLKPTNGQFIATLADYIRLEKRMHNKYFC